MDRFYKIEDKIFMLKGINSCNIYYLDFKKKAIIDTGHPLEAEKNINFFKQNGIDLAEIDYIINTHSHGDHNGANAFLKEKNTKIKIAAHKKYKDYNEIREKVKVLKGAEIEFTKYFPDYLIDDKFEIDLTDIKLKLFYTPGHTIDSVVIYLENKNIFFTGDLIYNKVITQLDYYQDLEKSLSELKSSYEKLLTFKPAVIYPGHGDKLINNEENINALLKKIKKLENNPESILINTLIPSAEFYINNNPGTDFEEVIKYFFDNMMKFKDQPFFIKIDEGRFLGIIEKMLSLMLFLNIIKAEGSKLYTVNELNYYLNLN
ncbi:MAG: MBL fold metallo-hydrolase [Spirochaetes bacterium]|nr:MBL fold metallo-hydrolase [Spirochaetota bacterium]